MKMDIFKVMKMTKKKKKIRIKGKTILQIDQNSDKEDNKDENNDQETQASLDADYSVDQFNLDEQLNEVESDEQSSEQIVKNNIDNINLDYKIFTTKYDEIVKAENLENADEATKLEKV